MKVLLGAAAMVCVRMSIKESIHKGSALAVAFDAIPKILRYIAGVIAGVIGVASSRSGAGVGYPT